MSRQLHPLEFNPKTGEPFLRLPAPHQNIILTPPREGDQAVLMHNMNDPAIHKWLERSPVPYLPEHADSWIQLVKGQSDATLEYLRKSEEDFPNGPLQFVDASPVRYLREVEENGTDVFIGDLVLKKSEFEDVIDEVERKRLQEENANKQADDPTIKYAVGDWLAASHHGRGIMTAAVGLFMSAWAIPRMGARHVVAYTFAGNIGSNRVFEKNGFVNKGLFDNGKIVRGEKKMMTHLEWKQDA
ncbi:GNAT domain-containing protein [Suillus ampliporus]|nr:GNAT domain-containing protein [Suillus ampliporus]